MSDRIALDAARGCCGLTDDDLLRIRAAMEAAIPHLNTYAAQLARYPVEDCHEAIRLREAIAIIDTVRTEEGE